MGFGSLAAAALLLASLAPARGLQSAGSAGALQQPTGERRWGLIGEAKGLHASPIHEFNPNETFMENLIDEWENKVGAGFPTFVIRRVDFQKPAPPFEYMFPAGAPDHEQLMSAQGVLEPYISFHLQQDMKKCCASGNGRFMDIGARFGWYSFLSASLGCSVESYEPVPWFQLLLTYNRYENNRQPLANKVNLKLGKFLANATGQRRTMVIPTRGAGVAAASEGQCDHGALCHDVETTTIDHEIEQDGRNSTQEWVSCGVRIDAEGLEPDIVQGGRGFFQKWMPPLVVLTVHPGMQKAVKQSNQPVLDTLKFLLGLGYIPHLLTMDIITQQNLNVARGAIGSRKFSQPVTELVKKCGVACVVYLTRPW